MSTPPEHDDRRKYPRLKAPIYFRSARIRLPRREVIDVGPAGLRVYSDDPFTVNDRIGVELFLPDGGSISTSARVAWTHKLPPDAPAVYDIGLELTELGPGDRERLAAVIERLSIGI